MRPLYVAKDRGASWSVHEIDASRDLDNPILHNLMDWQAKAIAAVLNTKWP